MTAQENAPAANRGASNDLSNELDPQYTATESDLSGSQLLPAGAAPSMQRLLLSGLLWADPVAVQRVASLVHPADVDEPHKSILEAVLNLGARGRTGPQAVLDELIRVGDASAPVRAELTAAITAGGVPLAVHEYAAACLAERFRAACESYGRGVIGWAADGSEAELWHGITTHGAALRKIADRLAAARGGEL